jgi:fumarate reductase flavoprotein subunit
MVEPRGVKASVAAASYSMVAAGQDREGPYKVWRTAVNWTGQNAGLMKVLHQILKEKGADIRYQHPGMKLVRDGKGRVTGVIAGKEGGSYIQFNARKGVILSCGGYDNNPEMMKKYLRPSDLRIARFNSMNKLCTGDGLNMGLAIGADMDEPPHCLIVGCGIIPTKEEFVVAMFTPWLRVDRNGRRYVNEDSDYCRAANANAIQPEHFNWVVIDSSPGEEVTKQFARPIKESAVLTADTIEELAGKMLIEPAVLKATVDRYNELAKNKKDADFGVLGEKMRPVLKAPYFAMQLRNFALVTVSGLRINENMQVLDKKGKAIAGLYASGNTSGGFFSDTYQRNVHGVSHGRAITFGRLAGIQAAAQKV